MKTYQQESAAGIVNHVELDDGEYLIVRTKGGVFDINPGSRILDMGDASRQYLIVRYDAEMRMQKIGPLTRAASDIPTIEETAQIGQLKRCLKCGKMVSNRFENYENHVKRCGMK